MNAHNSPVQKSGQHNKLARALTLALGLTISPFALSASGDVAPMATLVVQNCNDTGYGSLRDAVSQASSGDIIDMSALSCSTINLQSTLIISQANLTLRGKASTAPPIIYSPIIETTNNVKLLSHTGAGKLKLSKVTLQKGNATDGIGGCVDSISGSVELDSAALKYCTAERSGNARGGAIYAGADVKLTNSRIMGSKAISGSAIAKGGGIFAKGDVVIFDDSLIRNNTAQGADAYGGGIFAGGKLDAALKRSTISGNKVIAPASSGRAYGGGAFVTGVASVALGAGLQVSGNHATGNNAKGGGLFLSEAGNIKYSSFKNNKAGSGVQVAADGHVEIVAVGLGRGVGCVEALLAVVDMGEHSSASSGAVIKHFMAHRARLCGDRGQWPLAEQGDLARCGDFGQHRRQGGWRFTRKRRNSAYFYPAKHDLRQSIEQLEVRCGSLFGEPHCNQEQHHHRQRRTQC